MKRMRRSAPWLIITGLYLLGVTLALYAAGPSDPLTRDEMKSFVYEAIATSGVLVIGVAAGLLAWILARDREINGRRLDQIAQGLSDIASGMQATMSRALEALEAHNGNPLAHTAASEHSHGPMNSHLEAVEKKLDQLLLEHRVIRGSEDEVCAMIRSLRTRSPKDSPNPKREEDPDGFDGRTLRGKP